MHNPSDEFNSSLNRRAKSNIAYRESREINEVINLS